MTKYILCYELHYHLWYTCISYDIYLLTLTQFILFTYIVLLGDDQNAG